MQQQLAQPMQALLQQELAKHQQSMANKVQRIAERESGRPKKTAPPASRYTRCLHITHTSIYVSLQVQGIAEGLSKTAASMRESEHTTTDAISSSIQVRRPRALVAQYTSSSVH
jgi:hypothetical protein